MRLIVILFLFSVLSSCYPTSIGFKDNSMDSNLKTFSVENFDLSAPNAPVSYPITFVEYLKDGLLNNTKLKLIKTGGSDIHLLITGAITNYSLMPVAVQGNSQAALTRLTIAMRIEVENSLDPDKSFTISPSRFADFDSNIDINAVEANLLEEINGQILQDILNKLQADW
jgi:hypothetical protein